MRTTVRLNEALLTEAKKIAAESHRSLTSVIEDALRQMIAGHRGRRKPRLPLPVFHGTGVMPGVDLDNNAAVQDLMDEGEPIERLR
ncbi:MAG: type II toxin-antitoxin system VapB family antitoxin [Dehalococcoidia bacterium]